MPPTAPPLVDVADIIRMVGRPSFGRGQEYARDGAVAEFEWDAESGRITGVVRGNAPRPYRSRIELSTDAAGRPRPVDSTCTCPMSFDCKHVAATLLASNAAHVRSVTDAGASGSEVIATERAAHPEPAWKSAVTALTTPSEASGILDSARAPLGLQVELREQVPRTTERWRRPTGRTASSKRSRVTVLKLGVRPVVQNAKGNWVKATITWGNVAYMSNRMNLDPDQHRWFTQFAPLHRAGAQIYFGQESDWLYLDDFASPLLWHLLREAARLGIPLVGSKKGTTVTVAERAIVSLDAALSGTGDLRLTPAVTIDGHPVPAAACGIIGTHGVYAHESGSPPRPGAQPNELITLAPTAERVADEQRNLLTHSVATIVPASDVSEFLQEFYPTLRQSVRVTSADASVQFPEILPPTLVLTATFRPKHTLGLEWDWDYQHGERKPLHAAATSGYRDVPAERAALDRAGEVLPAIEATSTLTGLAAAEFTEKILPELARLDGVRVDLVGDKPDYRELTEVPKLTITTVETDERDWFDLGVIVTIEGRNVPFGPLFSALSQGKQKLLLVDGTYLSLNQPVFEQLLELITEARALDEWDTGLRISRYQASLWSDFEDLAEETVEAQNWRTAVAGLLEITAIEPVPLPTGLHATLRPYQIEGFTWLQFLHEHGLGGILADDMGLGKTLQTLALLAHVKERGGSQRPFLVVAPTSVVPNWVSEAQRFTPELKVAGITSTQAKSGMPLADVAAGVDVVITSYALFRLDFEAYQAQGFAGLILDEAQFVKNAASATHQCARGLDVPFKLAITGTPMENNLLELWSLFSIVAPGLFPSARKFTENYQRPIERGAGVSAGVGVRAEPGTDARAGGSVDAGNDGPALLAKLRRRIRPLMMRRTKEIVAKDLPAKQEQVLHIDLAPKHRKLYDTFLQRERQKLLGLIEDMDKNRFIIFRSLTLLRMLSLDASLVDEKYAGIGSSKLDALFEQLEDVLAEGHRALIFSQFTSFLGKAASRLDSLGIDYSYLDGSTRRRGQVIDGFKTGTAPVFLISLKAGGFGLNLTEADYVFLLDPWWNPATEEQAIDRTHRIGQSRHVMVYRMVATGTIEEKVMALKERKAKLFSAVMDDDAVFSSALTADDIRGLLEG